VLAIPLLPQLTIGAAAYPFAQVTIDRPTLIAGELDGERAAARV